MVAFLQAREIQEKVERSRSKQEKFLFSVEKVKIERERPRRSKNEGKNVCLVMKLSSRGYSVAENPVAATGHLW